MEFFIPPGKKICTYFSVILTRKTENMCIFFQPGGFFLGPKIPRIEFLVSSVSRSCLDRCLRHIYRSYRTSHHSKKLNAQNISQDFKVNFTALQFSISIFPLVAASSFLWRHLTPQKIFLRLARTFRRGQDLT